VEELDLLEVRGLGTGHPRCLHGTTTLQAAHQRKIHPGPASHASIDGCAQALRESRAVRGRAGQFAQIVMGSRSRDWRLQPQPGDRQHGSGTRQHTGRGWSTMPG
jgi:hypothetical protein